MGGLFWDNEKIQILITYLRNGVHKREIARKLNTTMDAVSNAITRYDLKQHCIQKPCVSQFLESIDFEDIDDKNFAETKKKAILQWKIAKSKKQASLKGKYEIGILWPDTHIPHQNDSACKAVLNLMSDIKVSKFIIMGDYIDLGCISHWNQNRHRTLELKRLKEDYIVGNALLDEIDKRLPVNCEKHYLEGNHEVWSNDLLESMPQLEGLIEPASLLKLAERKYKFHNYNDLLKIGRLYLTHGIYAGGNPIKKHVDELKVNIVFAHTHTLGMSLFSSPAREIAFAGYNVGCLCDLSPDYMKKRPNGWTHGFGVAYFYPNGYFDVQLVRIIDGKFIFNNTVYDGNK
jgi:hypothetical protein